MSDDIEEDSHDKSCQICNREDSKYCCPRCNLLYCSMSCYKSETHSQCSESFYKDSFMTELASMDNDPASKLKMMDIITKMNNPESFSCSTTDVANIPNEQLSDDVDFDDDSEDRDSDDDESIPDLANRLDGIDLEDSEALWRVLTHDEKKEFEAVMTNDISSIIPVWEPWWLFYKEKKLVSELHGNKPDSELSYRKSCPAVIENIKNFNNICKGKPASCLIYNVVNVLTSYIYVTRLFNGDYYDFPDETMSFFVTLSENLNNGTNFENVETALVSVIHESYNNESVSCSKTSKQQIQYDLQRVLRGPEECNKAFYVLCALSDMWSVLNQCKNPEKTIKSKRETSGKHTFEYKFPWSDEPQHRIPKDKVKRTMKKIEYYLSFIKDNPETIQNLQIDLHFE